MRECDRYAVRRHREHSGNGLPLREGHSGVWRSDAGHEDAREGRTVPEWPGQEAVRDHRGGHRGPEPAPGGPGGDAGRELPTAAHGVRRRRDVGDRGGLQRGGGPQSAPDRRAGAGAADGREGKLTERLETGACEGSWSTAIDNSSALVDDLVRPVSEVSRVLSAVAEGDLSPRMELRTQAPDGTGHPLRGEFLKVARTVNNL